MGKRFQASCIVVSLLDYLPPELSFVEAWFENWFGTRYYHLLYSHRNETEAQYFLNAILDAFPLNSDAHILDAACGKGRHSHYLARRGFSVDGFDLSDNNIEEARKLAPHGARFFVHDLRKAFASNTYDLVLNLFTSFGYFDHWDDNLRTLVHFDEALKPGGVAIIDFMNVQRVRQHLVPQEHLIRDDVEFFVQRRYEPPFIVKHIQVNDQGQCYHFRERVQALERGDFETMLSATAFDVVQLYGDYRLRPFDPGRSPRLILALQKRAALHALHHRL